MPKTMPIEPHKTEDNTAKRVFARTDIPSLPIMTPKE